MIRVESGGCLNQFILECGEVAKAFVMVTHPHLYDLYGKAFVEKLREQGHLVHTVFIGEGEGMKTRETKARIEDELLRLGIDNRFALIAFGGGVISDIAGFVASTFHRGMPYIIIPTTLIGMVDAAIGGKNGINVPQGKNLIGTIYLPNKVLVDPLLSQTLPLEERRAGFVEMVKHAIIADESYLSDLEKGIFLEEAIITSIQIKELIVFHREKEMRHLLNLGHTVGHALETISSYSLSHGEAVAIGIVCELLLSEARGLISMEEVERIENFLLHLGMLKPLLLSVEQKDFFAAMLRDKKSFGQTVYMPLFQGIGIPCFEKGKVLFAVDFEELKSVLWKGLENYLQPCPC